MLPVMLPVMLPTMLVGASLLLTHCAFPPILITHTNIPLPSPFSLHPFTLACIPTCLPAASSPLLLRPAPLQLLISLDFARANMEAAGERDMMMQMICEATQCEAEPVRVAAYECIVKIGADYYRHLASYMEVLYKLTFDSVKDDTEAVAMQAVEFWSTIADEEATLIDYEDETYAQYVLGALETLIPLLTSTLLKQDEYSDEDTWNLSTAGGACLNVVSMVAQNDVLTHVMPFVTSNIKEADWRQREAATLAFGSVIGGPDEEAITPIINEALGVLIEGTRDENVMVRDTTAWTLAKIAESHAECLTTSEGVYEAVVTSWIASLDDEPRVAHNVCFALHNLAVAAGDNDGNMLTPIFMKVMEKLVETSNRDDWQESNLRVGAYEAINQMIENCADDSLELVAQIMPLIIGRLEAAVGMQPATSDDKENRDSLITNLLGALQINIVRLDNEGPLEGKAFAGELDRIMTLALSVMQDAGAASAMEAFMVVGAICNASGSGTSHLHAQRGGGAMGGAGLVRDSHTHVCTRNTTLYTRSGTGHSNQQRLSPLQSPHPPSSPPSSSDIAEFSRYLNDFHPILIKGLNNYEQYQVCGVAVGCVGDLMRDAGSDLPKEAVDEIVGSLLRCLEADNLDRTVKPAVLSSFGDIAMALNGNFEPYMEAVIQMLHGASQTPLDMEDDEACEYVNQVRVRCFRFYAYTSYISHSPVTLTRHTPHILSPLPCKLVHIALSTTLLAHPRTTSMVVVTLHHGVILLWNSTVNLTVLPVAHFPTSLLLLVTLFPRCSCAKPSWRHTPASLAR